MQSKYLFEITKEQQNELINQLVSFASTDTLLFLPSDHKITTILNLVNTCISAEYRLCKGIDVPKQNLQQEKVLKKYLQTQNEKNITFIYQAGKELHSVLLAILLSQRLLDYKQAFELAFYEELNQQKIWGKPNETIERQQTILQKLEQLDKEYGQRSIS